MISFLLTGVFLYIAFRGVRLREVLYIVSQSSWHWVALLVLSLTTSHLLRAIRWKVILKSVKPDTSLLNLFGSLMVGYGVNSVIPRVGEITRAVLLGKWENLSRTSMFGTVILERIIDSIAFLAALLISVFVYSGNLYESIPWLKSTLYLISFFLAGVIVFLVLLIRYKEKFYNIIVILAGKISQKAAHKAAEVLEMLTQGFGSLKGGRNYFLTLFLTVLIICNYALNAYLGFLALDMQNIIPISFSMAWVLMSISSFGVAIPTPGGTGSYHVITQTILVLLFGFANKISLAYAVLTHAVSNILFIISALVFFFYLNNKYTKKTGKSEKLIDLIENNMDSI